MTHVVFMDDIHCLESSESNLGVVWGGERWTFKNPDGAKGPALLLEIDLSQFSSDAKPRTLLPLCSLVNIENYPDLQKYSIDHECREVSFDWSQLQEELAVLEVEDQMPIPLPSRKLLLRKCMTKPHPSERQEQLWGGEKFIQLFGSAPLDDELPDELINMLYIASVGYGSLPVEADELEFFLGEVVLHFFVSERFDAVTVFAQFA